MARKNEANKQGAGRPAAPKRRRVKVETGQLAAVPLQDGTFALLHVAQFNGWVIGAHYAHRKDTPARLLDGLDDVMKSGPISILAVSSDEIYDGHWPIIGRVEVAYPSELLDTKGNSYTASATRGLFEAYYGIRPWDEMAYPRWYDRMLLPGVPVPPTIRYKRDFENDAAMTAGSVAALPAAAPPIAAPPHTAGPAEIHIQIRYPGDALPSINLLHRRQALEQALEASGAGEVTDAGGGGGVMDIHLRTADVRPALPLVEAAVRTAGFQESATIQALPVDSGEASD